VEAGIFKNEEAAAKPEVASQKVRVKLLDSGFRRNDDPKQLFDLNVI
jgi:hypothetical protein